MLDQETKKKINDLRDTLVGKVPDPKSQVEQIMIALIYKFMNDMDKVSTDLGGEASFFVGDFEKYSWDNLFGRKVSGSELVDLYSIAVESMEENPNIPQLFRDIFKNAYIPYKDAETLRLFLSQIDDFEYSNDSEQLGDAFEHILNSLSSQGDAGQFRTPRHIIDFIVEIVDPKKDETVLDPASGTSGFLISAFKHIIKSNSEKSSGDLLTAAERKKIMKNINGYDISPDMVRIGLANMYLHGFPEPNVVEYDALTSEDRWNEYYDVILANPPFMTPKGGIRPHNKFGLKSNRAEVLFVDYILTHLKPKGRAGIIVPEGIIFQSGKAYVELRRKLVENGLSGVISLPSGVFNPYSGVKTSILIIDKHKQKDEIYFSQVNSDGFDLGAQRQPLDTDDLPFFLNEIKTESFEKSILVEKEKIIEKNYSLTVNSYADQTIISSSYDVVNINELCEFKRGEIITKKTANLEGTIPVVSSGIVPSYYHDKFNREGYTITISGSGNAGYVNFYNEKIWLSDAFSVTSTDKNILLDKYLYQVLKNKQEEIYSYQKGAAQKHVYPKDFENFQIPLPPLEKQQEIVDEIEQYQKVIDGARQVIENYTPSLVVDKSWKTEKLENFVVINNGYTLTDFDNDGDLAGIKVSDMNLDENQQEILISNKKVKSTRFKDSQILPTNSIIFPKRGAAIATNKKRITKIPVVIDNNCMGITVTNENILPEFVYAFFLKFDLTTISRSAGIALINNGDIQNIDIPVPPLDIQKSIVENFNSELISVKNNKNLIDNFNKKINHIISSLYE